MEAVADSSIIEPGMRAYARLRSRVRAAGILDRSYSFYSPLIVLTFAGYLLSAWAIFAFDGYIRLTFACLGFSFFTVQMAGVNHDSGHRAIFTSIRLNNILGITCSILIGLVFDNWRNRHNAHHAFPNQVGKDPDLEIPFLAAHALAYETKGPLQRYFMRYQAYYYYPLGALASFSNRLGSFSYFRHSPAPGNWKRLVAYLPSVLFLFVLPFFLFSPEKAVVVFLLVHVTSGVYLASCFAPNHKGMAVLGGDEKMSFIEQQVLTSRNVKGGWLTDLLLVGLNHQTEHHLFPSCPRNKLHLIRPLLIETCDSLGIKYVEAGIIETNRDIMRKLGDVQRLAGRPAAAVLDDVAPAWASEG